jgi:phosphofructokinase-like protein
MAETKSPISLIGVLTSGGDAPGLNAVIRAVVKTAILQQNWDVLGIEDGFEGMCDDPPRARPLGLDSVRGILPRGGTILGTSTRSTELIRAEMTPAGEKFQVDPKVLDILRSLCLDALVVIGGDGSLRIAWELWKLGAPVVGVPKTIDNDIRATDYTFGFDTALEAAKDALDRLHTTAESHHRVMILEVMGRDAGWIALQAGVSGGADVILIPEHPFDLQVVARAIEERYARGSRFSIVVVAEGARPVGGSAVYQPAADPRSRPRLGGIGQLVGDGLRQLCRLETRVTVLGHVQRGGSPTAFDRLLGTRFGAAAVRLIAARQWGRMVALRGEKIVSVSLEEAVAQPKSVSMDSDLVRTALAMGISLG